MRLKTMFYVTLTAYCWYHRDLKVLRNAKKGYGLSSRADVFGWIFWHRMWHNCKWVCDEQPEDAKISYQLRERPKQPPSELTLWNRRGIFLEGLGVISKKRVSQETKLPLNISYKFGFSPHKSFSCSICWKGFCNIFLLFSLLIPSKLHQEYTTVPGQPFPTLSCFAELRYHCISRCIHVFQDVNNFHPIFS